MPMVSQTKLNVQRKRKILRRKRRIKFFRIFVFLILLGCALTAAGWVSIKLYGWVSQTYATYAEIYDGYKQRRALRAASFDPRFDGYTNILFIGMDAGREDSGQQADNLFLASFNHDSGALRIINIPRFTLMEIPGMPQAEQRINNAYHYGGIRLLEQSVTKLLGVTVHHYVAIDIEALKEVVDVMGGIDVYVEAPMDYEDPAGDLYIHIPKGYQHMDGDTAQKYLRFSSNELGGYGRFKRQQAFVRAVYERALQPDMVTRLPLLADVWQRRASTTIESFDGVHFTNLVRKLSGIKPEFVLLPGEMDKNGSWICDRPAAEAKMAELFPAEPEDDGGFLGIF